MWVLAKPSNINRMAGIYERFCQIIRFIWDPYIMIALGHADFNIHTMFISWLVEHRILPHWVGSRIYVSGNHHWFRQCLSPARRHAIAWNNDDFLAIVLSKIKFIDIWTEYDFSSRECIWNCRLQNGSHIVLISMCWIICNNVNSLQTMGKHSLYLIIALWLPWIP